MNQLSTTLVLILAFFLIFCGKGSDKEGKKKKTKLKIIQELSIKVFDSDIRIYVCEGCVERKNKGYNLKFSPSGLKSTTERIPN